MLSSAFAKRKFLCTIMYSVDHFMTINGHTPCKYQWYELHVTVHMYITVITIRPNLIHRHGPYSSIRSLMLQLDKAGTH